MYLYVMDSFVTVLLDNNTKRMSISSCVLQSAFDLGRIIHLFAIRQR